jgi:hypothetical protein
MAAASLAIGLAMLHHPLDGMRIARGLGDGSNVCFYHQYRLWPGEHVTPCLETIASDGASRSYPIAHNVLYRAIPDLRTNADQSVVWFVDSTTSRNPHRYGGVWCMLDRRTGAFVPSGGPFPEDVSASSGFPPSR